MGGKLKAWRRNVRVVSQYMYLNIWRNVRNIVQRSVFTSIGKFPFGTKVLKVFTFHLTLNLKRGNTHHHAPSLRRGTSRLLLLRKVKEYRQTQNSKKDRDLGMLVRSIEKSFGRNTHSLLTVTLSIVTTLFGMGLSQFAPIAKSHTPGGLSMCIT